jgi:hypothetical protein
MAGFLIPHLTVAEREQAHLAARLLHQTSLTSFLKRQLRELRAEARRKYPDKFGGSALAQLKPIDRTVYRFLTEEGRRTLDDLIAETGLKRGGLKASLDRLKAVGVIGVIAQGGKTDAGRGARREIYFSLEEQ